MNACPTPAKARYATHAAADHAGRHAVITVGRHLRPYECRCGWWHLTKITQKGGAR
ncbi:hypothetical protein [Streptomyces antibioticus]|uniref:hypothetical protein n=1 Tax=Streptomyces antibioticus TaxID=1890 RepID=UPI0033E38A09